MLRSILFSTILFTTSLAAADDDRVAFGSDVHVREGETVRDAVAFGGDALIEGVVTGDAVAFGGSVLLAEGARVEGDVSSFGGDVRDWRAADEIGAPPPAARHHRESWLDALARWIGE